MRSFLNRRILINLATFSCFAIGAVNGWPAGPPSAREGRPEPPPSTLTPCRAAEGAAGGHAPLQTPQLLTRSQRAECGGHGKCSAHAQECVCDPCWSGHICTEYVDLHQPRFLVNNLYRVITRDVKGAVFRAEVTDDDLGLTCPLHGPGEAATCPCATVRFTLAPGGHAALFSLDNETGDVFLMPGVVLLPGNEYHLTLEAHGLTVAGWRGQRSGRDVMRAVLFISHGESLLEGLLLGEEPRVTPRHAGAHTHQRRKRQVKGGGIAVDLVRISPEQDEPLRYGSALHYKVVLRLPRGPWSQQVVLDISSEQPMSRMTPVLAVCGARVSAIAGPAVAHSSNGPLLDVRPRLTAHSDYTSMFVKAVFDLGVISVGDDELHDNVSSLAPRGGESGGAAIELTFEAVLANTTRAAAASDAAAISARLQYITASLANGEAGAQAAVNISTATTATAASTGVLDVVEGQEPLVMAQDTAASMTWAVTPASVSSDLALELWDNTPGPAQFRVGGLSASHIDDGIYCLAIPKAFLATIKCLLNNNKSIPRLLAKIYIPVYTKRTDSIHKSRIVFTSWLIPLKGVATNKNVTIETVIASGDKEWHSTQNVSIDAEETNSNKVINLPSTPTITVTSLSTSAVPRGVPILGEVAVHLPTGVFNLTITFNSKTKGIKPMDMSIIDVKPSMDRESINDYEILRPNEGELVYKPSNLVLNTEAAERSIVVRVAFVADVSALAGPATVSVTVAAASVRMYLNLTVLDGQAPIVTPEISVVPYEDEKAFDERGLLGFGILLEIPGGACTRSLRVEVGGHFSGLGDGEARLCAASFAIADPGLPGLLAKPPADVTGAAAGDSGVLTRELGPLCSATLLATRARQSATFRVAFHLASPTNSTLDGEVRMSGRVLLGGSAVWSGGVAVRVHRAPASAPTALSCFSTCTKLTCTRPADECMPA